MDWTTRIQTAVARIDLMLCEIGRLLPWVLAGIAAGALIALADEYRRRRGRRRR